MIYTIEKTYLVPVFMHERIEADTPEEAMQKAIDSDDWEGSKVDYDSSRATWISAAWEGEEAYPGGDISGLPIPDEFSDAREEA
jgi:hypothetical protein